MANIATTASMSPESKLEQMQEDAKYEISNSIDERLLISETKHSIRAKTALPKVPKVFLSNNCIFNCAYCGCRCSRDKRTYTMTPRELAEYSVLQSQEHSSGIFLSSAIFQTPDDTQELLAETLRIIRTEWHYRGFLHCKVMPGADPELILKCGTYADRLSVNIEVARSEGYKKIARNKNRKNILTPMTQISKMIEQASGEKSRFRTAFATSQTTQLMAGSTGEDDQQILSLSNALYGKYNLKRVYYTSYEYAHPAIGYEELEPSKTPDWRTKRLYQADRLMQLYGFSPEELTPEEHPNLEADIDPKAAWALRNLHLFPIEVNTADLPELMRIPGIGVTYAQRILKARRYSIITHDLLAGLGVSLKRSQNFLTCNGRFTGLKQQNPDVMKQLLSSPLDTNPLQLSFH